MRSRNTIAVEQAVFASSARGSIKGYQLISKSSGVDRTCSQTLSRWAPTRVPSDNPDHWTINYFPVSDDSAAVTRTVLGGPEYSSRGCLQVVTMILVLQDQQLASYDFNPIAVSETAMAMGCLKLPLDTAREQLPQATLPSRPIVERKVGTDREADSHGYGQLLDEIENLIKDARRIAVIGLPNPFDAVNRLVSRLSVETRRDFSFTTGLPPSVRRPFQAHFLPTVDAMTKRALDSQNIVRVNAA